MKCEACGFSKVKRTPQELNAFKMGWPEKGSHDDWIELLRAGEPRLWACPKCGTVKIDLEG
jgi:hypothetical protein